MAINVAQRLKCFMDYNRLFYMNITYECNNRCIFCISHNTKNKTRNVENPLEIIKDVNNEYKFNSQDLFIVNGGEPTTSVFFSEILDYLLTSTIKIIVYTNGRSLIKYLKYTYNDRIRWIVAFYGLQKNHDFYTRINGSFSETFESLQCIAPDNRSRISIKFLLENNNQIDDFRKLSKLLQGYEDIHISFILKNNNFLERLELAKSVSPLITELLEDHIIRISNIPICFLLKHQIYFNETKINTYYFIYENKTVKPIDYNKNHNWSVQCKDCTRQTICCDNYRKYRVLKLYRGKLSLEEE